MSYNSEHAARLKDIKSFGSTIRDAVMADNAGAHNAIYRGKNLGTSLTAAMYSKIYNGTYLDMYIGDYLELPIDGTTKAIFTGFALNDGALDMNGRGAILWLQNYSWIFPINDTNTLEGGYAGSKMFTEILPALLAKIEAVIDPSYIQSSNETISDALDSNGNVSHRTSVHDQKIFLPAPNNFLACAYTLFGANSYKLSDNANYSFKMGAIWPYAIFSHRQGGGGWFWSSSNYNNSSWITINDKGNYCSMANFNAATAGSGIYTWPYIVIK